MLLPGCWRQASGVWESSTDDPEPTMPRSLTPEAHAWRQNNSSTGPYPPSFAYGTYSKPRPSGSSVRTFV